MKKVIISATLVLLSFMSFAQSQDIPTTKVRDINGKQFSFNETFEKGKITVVSFWATWCIPCKQEIAAIQSKLPEWKKQVDFNFMTVSIDDARATAMVKTYAKSKGWDFPTYVDPNSDLKRSLGFQNPPFTMIIDQNGKIVYQHVGYEAGGEDDTFERVKALAAKK